MSKQQDELLSRVDELLAEVVQPVLSAVIDGGDTTGLAAEGTRKVADFIKSEVRSSLGRLDETAINITDDEDRLEMGNAIEYERQRYE